MDQFTWQDGISGTLIIDGVRLQTACYGAKPDQAPTIILLHEGLGCVALWRDFPQRLAAATGFGVFAYSRAGYGKSDPCPLPRPIDYMTDEALQTLPEILNLIGFKQGVLMGHSDGATIAAIHAGMSGDLRVRGVVLMAPHFFAEPGGLESIAQARVNYQTGDLRNKLAIYHTNVDCAFYGWNDVWLDPNFKQWNVAEVIDYLRIPVLAIQGEADEYGTLAQIDELDSRIYSPLDVEILKDCGHAPHIEQPENTLQIITEFADRLQRIESEVVLVSQ
ncbi:MAG: alpha/beta fold hydrolase [Rhizobiaceae bacterium]|nr:alpha/beta fold hydrolase [Rhizobiaceae bacterium]